MRRRWSGRPTAGRSADARGQDTAASRPVYSAGLMRGSGRAIPGVHDGGSLAGNESSITTSTSCSVIGARRLGSADRA
jgi:hypothetical protein